jgi:hypothetical protein
LGMSIGRGFDPLPMLFPYCNMILGLFTSCKWQA